ncbi:MAG: metallophosphoesterase [Oscillospiraceae bacterium]|jgi:hypothetical protein|nr:metallophosphoesterase [Oscillospiraceae bacterium]
MKLFKKACAIWLVMALLISMFTVSGASALESDDKTISVVKDSGVTFDGVLDEDVWSSMQPVEKRVVGDTTPIDASFNVTWDNSNMYIGVQVTGADESKTSFDDDSISYYLTPHNDRGAYSEDDFQVQIGDKGTSIGAGYSGSGKNATLKVSDISAQYQSIENGYTMEVKMPWSVVGMVPHDVCEMGFDLMAFSAGESDCVMVWSGTTNNWTDTSDFGTLTFTGDGTEPNGQTLRTERNIFEENAEISMNYTKAAENDAVCVVPDGGNPEDSVLEEKTLTEGSGKVVYSAEENTLEPGDYEAVLYNPENGAVYARASFAIGEVKIWTEESSYSRLDKTDITVHYADAASGSWIGVYYAGDVPGSSYPSIVWGYTDSDSGEITFTTDDFSKSTHPNFSDGSKDYLRSGDYKVVLFKDGGYAIDQACPFTVAGPQLTLDNHAYSLNFQIDLDYSGTDAVNNKDWVGIYKKGETPGDSASYAFKYATGESGTLTFTQEDVKQYSWSPLEGGPLPEGDYELILLANDGYGILDRVPFSLADTEIYTPDAASYDRSGARTGYADGTVTITDSGHKTTSQYVLYWGDDNGKLNEFDSIDTVARTEDATTYQMTENTFIPAQATKLLVYSSNGTQESDTPVSCDLPDGVKFADEAPLYTFDVISDTHVQAWDSEMNARVNMAFEDIKKNDPHSQGIIVNGDMVDQGFDENYNEFFSIVNKNQNGLPPLYLVMGNHEFMDFATANPYTNALDGKEQRWLNYTQNSSLYYDTYINGQHFIMLGSEGYTGLDLGYDHDYCDISEAQFSWLRTKLAETKDKKEPIFLFLHQPMLDTVAGSMAYQGWNGVKPEQEQELRSILKEYPQVIMFNGHTHWLLESDHEMYDGKNTFASIFNTASAGYLWSDEGQEISSGEGLYIEVYKDKLLVKGRNYTDGKWVPKAFFSVDMNEKYQGISEDDSGSSSHSGSGSHSGSSSHSGGSSSQPAAGGDSSTVQKTQNSAGRTIVSVAAQPDAAAVVSGGKATVNVTVPQTAMDGSSSVTAANPMSLNITAPASALISQLNNSAVHAVSLTVRVPSEALGNTNENIQASVNLPKAVVQTAKDLKKDIILNTTDSQTGKLAHSWTLSGQNLSNSVSSVVAVDTVVKVKSVKNDTGAAKIVAENTADHQSCGTMIHFAENGLLPAPAAVRVYVGDQDNCGPNSKVYFYYVNRATGVLEQMPKSEYTVDADGYVTVHIMHCSDYVLMPKKATTPYPVQSDTTYPVGVKKGQSYMFGMTVTGNAAPAFGVGNGKVFLSSVKRVGNRYFFTVKAIGNPGETTAVYSTLPGKKAVPMCYITVR